MAKVCTACGNSIQGSEYMECVKCKKFYDLLCLNLTKEAWKKLTQKQKEKWICPSSLCSLPKGDNSTTPARSNFSVPRDDNNTDYGQNVTMSRGSRTKAEHNSPDSRIDLAEILHEIKKLREEVSGISALRKEVADLQTQVSSISTTINETLFDYKRKLEDANREIASLKCAVFQSQKDLELQELNIYSNELEIIGLPEESNEKLLNKVIATTKRLGVDLDQSDVSYVTRTGPLRTTPSSPNKPTKPRAVVVKLVRRLKRDEIIKAGKTYRKHSDGVSAGSQNHIFINERLTKKNKQLFHEARTRSRMHNFQYCWTRNGIVYARQAEKKPALRILTPEDLDDKIGPANTTNTD